MWHFQCSGQALVHQQKQVSSRLHLIWLAQGNLFCKPLTSFAVCATHASALSDVFRHLALFTAQP